MLIHSPLIGPTSWLPVADALERQGRVVVVPPLRSGTGAPAPQREIPDTVQRAARHLQGPITLVAHSGAVLLLPVIADADRRDRRPHLRGLVPATRCRHRRSRTPRAHGPATRARDRRRAPAAVSLVRKTTSCANSSPTRIFARRSRRKCPRLSLSYFESAVSLPADWRRRPCAYLLISPDAYGQSATEAEALGWPVRAIRDAHHLSIATDPIPITEALVELEHRLTQPPRSHR